MYLPPNFPNAQSYLLTGGTENDRLKTIDSICSKLFGSFSGHPDFLVLEEKLSIGISQIRNLRRTLALKPFNGKFKLAVIKRAEKMTTEAQNALLKTLEEPNPSSVIILETAIPCDLLATIISRCQIISLRSSPANLPEPEVLSELKSLLKAPLFKRLIWSEKNSKDIKDSLFKINIWLIFWRNILLEEVSKSDKNNGKPFFNQSVSRVKTIIEYILKAQNFLENKVNNRLVFDWLMLKLPQCINQK